MSILWTSITIYKVKPQADMPAISTREEGCKSDTQNQVLI